jgi:hypothetical protein
MRAREKQISEMIAATVKLKETADRLDLGLLSSLYRMCALELANTVEDEEMPGRPRERPRATLN